MTFPFPAISPAAAAAVTYIGATESTSNATVYTFNGVSIGAASSDRIVHVGAVGLANGAAQNVTGITIGGVAAELNCVATNGASGGIESAIASLAVASGTTADIVVTFGVAQLRCAILVWTSTSANGAFAYDAGTDSDSDPLTTSVDVPSNGFAIGVAGTFKTGWTGNTWTGLSEDADFVTGETTNQGYTGASEDFSSTQSGLSVSCDCDGGAATRYAMCVATFSPNSIPYLPSPVIAFLAEDIPSSASMTSWTNRGTGGATYDITAGSREVPSGAAYGTNGYNGIYFDGSGEYLLMSNEYAIGTGSEQTFAFVIKGPSASERVVALGQHSATNNGASMVACSADSVSIHLRGGDDSGSSTVGFPSDVWVSVVIVKNASGWRPYINGVAGSLVSVTFTESILLQAIGYRNYYAYPQYSLGNVQEIRVFNTAFDSNQVNMIDTILRAKFAI